MREVAWEGGDACGVTVMRLDVAIARTPPRPLSFLSFLSFPHLPIFPSFPRLLSNQLLSAFIPPSPHTQVLLMPQLKLPLRQYQ